MTTTPREMQDAERVARRLREWFPAERIRVLPDGSVAFLHDLAYTRAIHLDASPDGTWAHRFCFENRALATQRFRELQSADDIPAGHIATRQGVGGR